MTPWISTHAVSLRLFVQFSGHTRRLTETIPHFADGVAGIVGLVFTGVFAQAEIAATDGYTVIPGGWLDGNYVQVGWQLAYICAVWGW